MTSLQVWRLLWELCCGMCKQKCSVTAKCFFSTKIKAVFKSLRNRNKFSKVTCKNHGRTFSNIALHWLLHRHRDSPILKFFHSKRKDNKRV